MLAHAMMSVLEAEADIVNAGKAAEDAVDCSAPGEHGSCILEFDLFRSQSLHNPQNQSVMIIGLCMPAG